MIGIYMQTLVITFISNDRPGLVEQLSRIIQAHGGNWLESQMAQLSGKFTGIIEINLPTDQSFKLTQTLQALSTEGISVLIEAVNGNQSSQQHASGKVSILGLDRPGIVNEISTALAVQSINVESFHSFVEAAAMSGEPLFKAELKISIPAQANIEELGDKLEFIAQQLDIDCLLNISDQ